MKKTTETTTIKLKREITDSEMRTALRNSMDALFEEFEKKLAEKDGQTLMIQVSAKKNNVKLLWDIAETKEE